MYHCDSFTGFLNRVALKRAEIGIYHAGIEVYGEEWSFQYFEDTWDDPSVSGVLRCCPRRMIDYDYQDSVNLGPTPLSVEEVEEVLRVVHCEWPACSYHITHRNCLTFADHFAGLLKAPTPFPPHLLGILEASKKSPSTDALVDYSWSWAKWWMRRKHRVEEPPPQQAAADHRGGFWAVVTGPTQTCSSLLCPELPKKSAAEDRPCDFAPPDTALVRPG